MKSLASLLFILVLSTPSFAKKSEWPEMSIFHLSSGWKNETGKDFKLEKLQGKLTVMAMVYTTCKHTCPMITSKLIDIQRKIPKKLQKNVQLSLVSFDPERDTPEVLNSYKKKRNLGSEWTLLTGSSAAIRELAAVLGVNYKKEKNGDFSHSNIITLLNKKGEVVEQIPDLSKSTDKLSKKIIELLK